MRIYILTIFLVVLFSCQDEFLQKPDTTGITNLEIVFSTSINAESAIASAYHDALKQGIPYNGDALNLGTLAALSGEHSRGWTWHYAYQIINNGMSATGHMEDNYDANYEYIRKCYLVLENIDKVVDMDSDTKEVIKAEMRGLIAYRYMGMFIRYGGIPLVSKVLASDDDLNYPRATLQQTQDTILSLCDRAAAVLPNVWPDKWGGRLTKGAVLAIKARTLMYAARPLFNAAEPYLTLGQHNNLICFGDRDQTRWNKAIEANEALLQWASENNHDIINTGGASAGSPNPNAFADYGNATSTPGNKEVLLSYKWDKQDKLTVFHNISNYVTIAKHDGAMNGLHTGALENYYKADGGEQVWPGLGKSNSLPGSDYLTKIRELEPRFQVDNKPHGLEALNNSGDDGWSSQRVGLTVNREGSYGKGCAFSTKYFYKAGSRVWFEYPLFRMAEFHLNLAEAYNEIGDNNKALEHLNIIHNRAGLPIIKEKNQNKLREIIQREWSIEYYNENQRYFLVKHWKLQNIGDGIIGGPRREFQFTTNDLSSWFPESFETYYDAVVFNAYWSPKLFLNPIPQSEINKGTLIQNPGY